jgi:hypothetical protein
MPFPASTACAERCDVKDLRPQRSAFGRSLTPTPDLGAPKNSRNGPKKDQEQSLQRVDPVRPFRNDKSAGS